MKWNGPLSKNIEAIMRLNNALLVDPKVSCRCDNVVDMAQIAEYELGSKLGIALKNMDEYLQWDKKWNALHEKALAGKILLDKFYGEQVRLWAQYQKKSKDWGSKDVSYSADVICPKCYMNLGKLTVTLRIADAPELMELTKKQLTNLGISRGMLAYTSKRMQFGSVEELKEWLNNEDAEQAKTILQKSITDLNELNLPYETSKITGTLTSLIGEVDKEIHRRKVEFVNVVEKIMKERVRIIT